MALGKKKRNMQNDLFIPAVNLPEAPGHPFYKKLNAILAKTEFDRHIEELARPYYHDKLGRPSLDPGVYVRMLFIGFFEGLDSERGIAWRCADSFSLKDFIGYELTEKTPDHSTLSKTRKRLPIEFHNEVFSTVLELLVSEGLLKGKTIAIDASTMEADAAMRALVRKESGENYMQFIKRLAIESGIETPTIEELIRFDKKRKNKTMSNKDWEHPHDGDARVAKLKNGRTAMAHKVEHAADLDSGAVVSANIYPADEGDTSTGVETLANTRNQLFDLAGRVNEFETTPPDAVTDKGYHSGPFLKDVALEGFRSYVSETDRGKRVWTDEKGIKSSKKAQEQSLTYANRRRIKGNRGKRLQRKRSEIIERGFAHTLTTGGMRRTYLWGRENISKRYLIHVAGFNLSLVMRKLFGFGKPRSFAACILSFFAWIFGWLRFQIGRGQFLGATRN